MQQSDRQRFAPEPWADQGNLDTLLSPTLLAGLLAPSSSSEPALPVSVPPLALPLSSTPLVFPEYRRTSSRRSPFSVRTSSRRSTPPTTLSKRLLHRRVLFRDRERESIAGWSCEIMERSPLGFV
nr:uncharacterized protein CTRU02_09620 [Colletotrichum truncatum]KAF6788302.1 hypothetical protein CTRU02_09620 [Colletotrichum truncatum]